MTSGEPTAPKPTVVSRPATTRSVRKQSGRPAKSNGSANSVGNEPTVSKVGGGALKRIMKSADAEPNEDVLERLARLGEAPVPAADGEVIDLPEIVEADPTFPPLERPTSPHLSDTDSVSEQHSPAARSAATDSVAADAMTATALASVPPSAVDEAESTGLPATAAMTALDAATPAALVPDRTDVAPPVPPVPFEPAVVPVPEAAVTSTAPLSDATGGVTLPLRRLRTPVVFRRARPRVRRVTRVVRHVDTWSVFKVALVFNVILYLCCLTSGVLLWNVAHATGTIDNVEKFFEQFGWESFEFKGGEIYHNAWIGGLFVAVGLTGFAVLLATLFNLITDLVGGIRVSVLEEEVIAKPRQGDPTDATSRP